MPLTTLEVERDADGDPVFNDYYLRKSSRIVRIRHNRTCLLCKNLVNDISYLQSHHIFPKHEFCEAIPYWLHFQVALCCKCHHRIVHSDKSNETSFRVLFWNYLNRKDVRAFNDNYQYKITGDLSVPDTTLEKYDIGRAWLYG